MKPAHAIYGKTREIKLLIESYGFVSRAIFGSTARGTDVDGSDLDILATMPCRHARQNLTVRHPASRRGVGSPDWISCRFQPRECHARSLEAVD
ncbi:nucleotidyltransferase domain-containing protein [Pseudomonas sp. Pseu.R1]|uniref:nucleotidyltransferase domain-containing protein n=1 Tax=Pseudomonas sp. Pseu.R1 TaxID=3379818 RepID=UPI003B93E985